MPTFRSPARKPPSGHSETSFRDNSLPWPAPLSGSKQALEQTGPLGLPETFQHRRARACLQALLILGGICSRSGFSMKCLSPKREVASRSHREGLDWGALLETPGVEPALFFYSRGNQREKRSLAQVTYGPVRTANTTQRHSSQASIH